LGGTDLIDVCGLDLRAHRGTEHALLERSSHHLVNEEVLGLRVIEALPFTVLGFSILWSLKNVNVVSFQAHFSR
jgi:hypothetical protein